MGRGRKEGEALPCFSRGKNKGGFALKEFNEVQSGKFKIVVAKDSRGEPLGWALPGGEITKDIDRVLQVLGCMGVWRRENKK